MPVMSSAIDDEILAYVVRVARKYPPRYDAELGRRRPQFRLFEHLAFVDDGVLSIGRSSDVRLPQTVMSTLRAARADKEAPLHSATRRMEAIAHQRAYRTLVVVTRTTRDETETVGVTFVFWNGHADERARLTAS